jgi:hypothetical protein
MEGSYTQEMAQPPASGLCELCRHAKKNRNDRGSVFLHCRRSEKDPRFPKYPPLPVVRCEGFEP